MAAAKAQSDMSYALKHVNDAMALVSRGGDHVQIAIQHLGLALQDLIQQLSG